MTKRKMLIIVAAVLLVCTASVICINISKKPKHYESPIISEQKIKYNGKIYYPIGDSGAFEYRCNKMLDKGMIFSISSLENDDNINFLSYKNTEIEGRADKHGDTRILTGIEINNPKAVEMLDEYSEKYFDYILND